MDIEIIANECLGIFIQRVFQRMHIQLGVGIITKVRVQQHYNCIDGDRLAHMFGWGGVVEGTLNFIAFLIDSICPAFSGRHVLQMMI